MKASIASRHDGALPLTDWKLRNLVSRLERRGFFLRHTYGRRLTYYTNRMSRTAFEEAIFRMKTAGLGRKTQQKHEQANLNARILAERARLATEGRIEPKDTESVRADHRSATQSVWRPPGLERN